MAPIILKDDSNLIIASPTGIYPYHLYIANLFVNYFKHI